jgi:hypothetical protein
MVLCIKVKILIHNKKQKIMPSEFQKNGILSIDNIAINPPVGKVGEESLIEFSLKYVSTDAPIRDLDGLKIGSLQVYTVEGEPLKLIATLHNCVVVNVSPILQGDIEIREDQAGNNVVLFTQTASIKHNDVLNFLIRVRNTVASPDTAPANGLNINVEVPAYLDFDKPAGAKWNLYAPCLPGDPVMTITKADGKKPARKLNLKTLKPGKYVASFQGQSLEFKVG